MHPGNIWITEALDDIQIIGFYNSCSKQRMTDVIVEGTPPYFLDRYKYWSPGSQRWDLHAWAVIAAEMLIDVEHFSTFQNGSLFWRVVECSEHFHPYTKLHDVLRELLKYGELQQVKDQYETIMTVLDDSEFVFAGKVLKAQNISEQYDALKDDIVSKYGARAFY